MKRPRFLTTFVLGSLVLYAGPGGRASASPPQSPPKPQSQQQQLQQEVDKFLKGLDLGKSGWSGTIVITETSKSTKSEDNKVCCKSDASSTMTNTVGITLKNGVAVATIDYRLREQSDSVDKYEAEVVTGTRTDLTTASGISKDVRVNVAINDDGSYEIEFDVPGIQGRYEMVATSTVTRNPGVSTVGAGTTTNKDSAQPDNLGGVTGSVLGQTRRPSDVYKQRLDAAAKGAQPPTEVLKGSETDPTAVGNPAGTRTVTWNLSRTVK